MRILIVDDHPLVREGVRTLEGVDVEFTPSSLHCYTVGRNSLDRR